LRRAQQKKKIKIKIYNLRDFTDDKRKTVDDRPFGGGPGMVLKVEPILKAINKIKKICPERSRKIILLSAKGKKFDQKKAKTLTKFKNIILICGRYEGVDERVAKHIANEEISIGDYILSGGELGAMVIVETVSRLISGVLGNEESIEENRYNKKQNTRKNIQAVGSYPVYTRPEEIKIEKKKRGVPKVLLSGDHKKIEKWRSKQAK